MPVLPWAAAPWRAWQELFSERDTEIEGVLVGMGAGRIASRPRAIRYQALLAWCAFECLSDAEARFVMACVRSLDGYYVQRKNDQITADFQKLLRV